VLKATAPEPWNAGRAVGVAAWVRGGSSIPSDFVGIVSLSGIERQRTRIPDRLCRGGG